MAESREILLKAAREGKLAKYFLGLSPATELDVPKDCSRCNLKLAQLIADNAEFATPRLCEDFANNKARVRTAINPLVFFPKAGTNKFWEDELTKQDVGEPRTLKTWNSQNKGANW